MPEVHIISRTYQSPFQSEPTVNHDRVYESDPVEAIATIKRSAAPFERIALVWSVSVSEAEYRAVRSL